MIIDLRSDTVTKPTQGMKTAMFEANLGDDVFAEDPTVNALEEKVAHLFGHEAAIFCPSGTMTNQIAIKMHTQPLDEVICDKLSHIYKYEVGGYANNSGVCVKTVDGNRGRISPKHITDNINPDFDWLPISRLVVVDNTCNKGGGSYYTLDQLSQLSKICQENQLKFHLDGARLMNALVESKNSTQEIGNLFDSVSLCISKGLGAPVGSVLTGTKTDIRKARRIRKSMGGGMRQAGFLAAACIYAIDHQVERLLEDPQNAKNLEEILATLSYVKEVVPVDTNIIIFELEDSMPGSQFIEKLAKNNIKAVEFGPQQIRFVTHLDFTSKMLDRMGEVLKNLA